MGNGANWPPPRGIELLLRLLRRGYGGEKILVNKSDKARAFVPPSPLRRVNMDEEVEVTTLGTSSLTGM